MKKQRKPIRLTGVYIMVDGEKVVPTPEQMEKINNNIAAVVRTAVTGIKHSVIA